MSEFDAYKEEVIQLAGELHSKLAGKKYHVGIGALSALISTALAQGLTSVEDICGAAQALARDIESQALENFKTLGKDNPLH